MCEIACDAGFCAICQDSEDQLTDFTVLACKHQFHSHCIAKWLWHKKGAMSCPLCHDRPQPSPASESEDESDLTLDDMLMDYRQRRARDSARLHNVLRRKFKGRRETKRQERYRDLGKRISELQKQKNSLSRSIAATSRYWKQRVRELNDTWKAQRRELYDHEKEATKQTRRDLRKITAACRKARSDRRTVAQQLLSIDHDRV